MPAYYTHFSCLLPLSSTVNVKPALDLYEVFADELDEKSEVVLFQASIDSHSEPLLWLSSGDDGDPEQAIAFALRCAARFDLSGLWGFQWTHGCWPPRLDAFSAGSCVIDLAKRCVVDQVDTQQWLSDRLTQKQEQANG